ncbi:hypothetical protein KCV03_g9819, partial [Aureobasidium melanogenum]
MRRAIAVLAACASFANAQIATTSIDIDAISVAVPTSVFVLPVVYVTADNAPPVTATTLAVTATASSDPSATSIFDSEQDVSVAISSASVLATASATAEVQRRDATICIAQPTGINYNSSPDTPAAFASDIYYNAVASANSAAAPTGYVQSFAGLTASNSAENYMGFTLLTSYDVPTCAQKCSAMAGCNGFNIYFERDPIKNPDDVSCANPASTINVKCVFWGGAVTSDNAKNFGQWRNQFQVLIAGSNGYIASAYAAALASGKASSTSVAPTSQETDSLGYTYDIYSGYDSSQGSYANAQASNSYKDCEIACDADISCKAFTYVGGVKGVGSGTCWLKSQLGNPTPGASNVLSGKKIGKISTPTTAPTTTASYANVITATQCASPKAYYIQVDNSGTAVDGTVMLNGRKAGSNEWVYYRAPASSTSLSAMVPQPFTFDRSTGTLTSYWNTQEQLQVYPVWSPDTRAGYLASMNLYCPVLTCTMKNNQLVNCGSIVKGAFLAGLQIEGNDPQAPHMLRAAGGYSYNSANMYNATFSLIPACNV